MFFSFYTIIVNPKIDLSFNPKPSEVTSYDKENPDKAYISGIILTYRPTFTVGMCSLNYIQIFEKFRIHSLYQTFFLGNKEIFTMPK